MNSKCIIKVLDSSADYRYRKCVGKKYIVKKIDYSGYHIRNYDKGVPQNFIISPIDAEIVENKKGVVQKFDKILYGFFIFITGVCVGYGWAFSCYFLQGRW